MELQGEANFFYWLSSFFPCWTLAEHIYQIYWIIASPIQAQGEMSRSNLDPTTSSFLESRWIKVYSILIIAWGEEVL
jgi:hypothetical protein